MPMLYCGKSKAGSSVKTLIKTLVFSARFPTTKKKNYMERSRPRLRRKNLCKRKRFRRRNTREMPLLTQPGCISFLYIHFRFVEKNNVIASLEELRSIIFAAFRCSTLGCAGGHSKTLLLA